MLNFGVLMLFFIHIVNYYRKIFNLSITIFHHIRKFNGIAVIRVVSQFSHRFRRLLINYILLIQQQIWHFLGKKHYNFCFKNAWTWTVFVYVLENYSYHRNICNVRKSLDAFLKVLEKLYFINKFQLFIFYPSCLVNIVS